MAKINQSNLNDQVHTTDPNQEDNMGTHTGKVTNVPSNEDDRYIGIYDGPSTSTGVGAKPRSMQTWTRWKRMVNYPKNIGFMNKFMPRKRHDSDSSSSDSEIRSPILKFKNLNTKEANWNKYKNMEASMSKLLEKNTISTPHKKGNEEGSTNIKLNSNQVNILQEKYKKIQMFCNNMKIEENPHKTISGSAKRKSSKPKQLRKTPY